MAFRPIERSAKLPCPFVDTRRHILERLFALRPTVEIYNSIIIPALDAKPPTLAVHDVLHSLVSRSTSIRFEPRIYCTQIFDPIWIPHRHVEHSTLRHVH